METSLLTTSLIGVPSCLHTDFPEDPERDFISLANILLAKLGLVDLIPTIHNLDKSPTDDTNSQKSAYSQLQFNYMSTGVEESQTNDSNHSDPEESDVEIGLLGGSAMPNESQASIKPSMSFFEQYKYKR